MPPEWAAGDGQPQTQPLPSLATPLGKALRGVGVQTMGWQDPGASSSPIPCPESLTTPSPSPRAACPGSWHAQLSSLPVLLSLGGWGEAA